MVYNNETGENETVEDAINRKYPRKTLNGESVYV